MIESKEHVKTNVLKPAVQVLLRALACSGLVNARMEQGSDEGRAGVNEA